MLPIGMLLFGYIFGSIPTAQIVAAWQRGIDLRRYGSGTVSGSMVYEHVGKWWVIPVGLFDILKGFLPTWLALRLNLGENMAVLAGLAALAGHNWPIFLRFTGGRGLSIFLGSLLAIFPYGAPWLLVFLALGYLLGDSAPFALAGIASMPLLVAWLEGPWAVYGLIAGMLLVTLIKRLEANRRPLPADPLERRKVILRRLFLDRDIANHQAWIKRTPER